MTDPFAAALDALFAGPGSAAAVYHPIDDDPFDIRVIPSQPDEIGPRSIIQSVNQFDVRRSDVPQPAEGHRIIVGGVLVGVEVVGGKAYEIVGEAVSDVEQLTWIVGTEPLGDKA